MTELPPVPMEPASSQSKLPLWTIAAIGGCAGVIVDLVLFPLDTIKTRLQKRGAAVAPVGARSFYRGLLSGMAGSFPSGAIFLSVYEGTKKEAIVAPGDSIKEGLRNAACAGAADITVASLRTPFEVR